jgi:hypothetical protein
MDGSAFVAGLVAEMQELFAGLGEQGALEAESQGRVEIPTAAQAGAPERARSERARRAVDAVDAGSRGQADARATSATTR